VSELQGLQLRMDEFKKRGVTMAGVVVDSVEENAQLQRDAGLEFPILSDPKFDLIGAYNLRHPSGHDGHDIALSASVLRDGAGFGGTNVGGVAVSVSAATVRKPMRLWASSFVQSTTSRSSKIVW